MLLAVLSGSNVFVGGRPNCGAHLPACLVVFFLEERSSIDPIGYNSLQFSGKHKTEEGLQCMDW